LRPAGGGGGGAACSSRAWGVRWWLCCTTSCSIGGWQGERPPGCTGARAGEGGRLHQGGQRRSRVLRRAVTAPANSPQCPHARSSATALRLQVHPLPACAAHQMVGWQLSQRVLPHAYCSRHPPPACNAPRCRA